ncbi:hypothetical protein [Zarconia navalis]|nr:hypothetical protein [Zarconia navalis]
MPIDTFESFFQELFVREALKVYQVKLVVYHPIQEVIVLWNE